MSVSSICLFIIDLVCPYNPSFCQVILLLVLADPANEFQLCNLKKLMKVVQYKWFVFVFIILSNHAFKNLLSFLQLSFHFSRSLHVFPKIFIIKLVCTSWFWSLKNFHAIILVEIANLCCRNWSWVITFFLSIEDKCSSHLNWDLGWRCHICIAARFGAFSVLIVKLYHVKMFHEQSAYPVTYFSWLVLDYKLIE